MSVSRSPRPLRPPELIYLYFLDWRPTAALPAATALRDVRTARITFQDIASSVYRDVSQSTLKQRRKQRQVTRLRTEMIPNADILEVADAIGRNDGLFVARLAFRADEGAAKFDWEKDRDELARIVCMALKTKFGHTHYYHNMPNRTRMRRLSPPGVLKNYPVELDKRDGVKIFAKGRLDNEVLISAQAERSGKKPEHFGPRIALVHLRRSFFKVHDDLMARIARDRQDEIRFYKKPLIQIIGIIAGLFVSALSAAVIVRPEWYWLTAPFGLSVRIPFPKLGLSGWFLVLVAGSLLWQAFETLASLIGHTLRRVKLLRAAHGFFASAQPLNEAIQAIQHQALTPTISGFTNLLATLQSMTEGEAHRVTMKQFWASFAVALAALVISALGVAIQTSEAAQQRLEEASQSPIHITVGP